MALNFRDNVSYENTDLGMLGAAAEGGLSQGGGTMDMLKGVVEGTGGTLASVFEGGSDLGALAALQLNVTNKVLGEGVKAAAKQAAGVFSKTFVMITLFLIIFGTAIIQASLLRSR